jgi:hypothetical protein
MTEVEVAYEWYTDVYRGDLSEVAFSSSVPSAQRHVRWLCGGREPADEYEEVAYKRALCAAAEAFADYGDGQVGGFTLGDFKVGNYDSKVMTGSELATETAVKELAGTSLMFSGVR